jgi:DNA-directed RNA polymerase specialized sigma24 family protein
MTTEYLLQHYDLIKSRLFQRYPDVNVDDVVQDTYCHALESIQRLGHPAVPPAWLWTLAKRVIARQRLLAPPPYEAADLDGLVAATREPWKICAARELYDGALKRIDQLGQRGQRLVKGYYLDQRPLCILAQENGMTRGAAKSFVNRARRTLRKKTRGWRNELCYVQA